jgi:hypothetical protein
LIGGLKANRGALVAGFTPPVFATDKVLELMAGGMPFRKAYDHVKAHLEELTNESPEKALAKRAYPGSGHLKQRLAASKKFVNGAEKKYYGTITGLLGIKYPNLV